MFCSVLARDYFGAEVYTVSLVPRTWVAPLVYYDRCTLAVLWVLDSLADLEL